MAAALDLDDLNRLADDLRAYRSQVDISRWNAPTNREAEQARFVQAFEAGERYNPKFSYEPLDRSAIELARRTRASVVADDYWSGLVRDDLTHSIDALEAVASHDSEKITASSLGSYGEITGDTLEYARTILSESDWEPDASERQTAQQAAIRLGEALSRAGLNQWAVRLEQNMSADMRVRAASQEVFIRSGATFSNDSIDRLVVHEIGTHVFRGENGMAQPLRLLGLGLSGYLATEEGLAAYHEEHFGLGSAEVLRKYALRVVATHAALDHSFSEVAEELRAFAQPAMLFSMLSRVKRGFIDTSEHGAHVKDKVYLEGLMSVRAAAESDPQVLTLLMIGKISLSQLPDVQALLDDGWASPPMHVPADLLS